MLSTAGTDRRVRGMQAPLVAVAAQPPPAHLYTVQLPLLHQLGQHVVPADQHLLRLHPLQQRPNLHYVLIPAM